MRQCELERVVREKNNPNMKRTGEKMVTYIDKATSDLQGKIIDLKKLTGYWIVDKVHDLEIQSHQLKHNWHVGGL